jgi:hypothetical protein
MLKEKGYDDRDVTVNHRINKAVEGHLLTKEMGEWAHQIRLEANDPRHADKNASIPTVEQADQSIEFAEALADILFVLPSRVRRGIERALKAPALTGASGRHIKTVDSVTHFRAKVARKKMIRVEAATNSLMKDNTLLLSRILVNPWAGMPALEWN